MLRAPVEIFHVPENGDVADERVRLPGPVFSTTAEPETAPARVTAVDGSCVAMAAFELKATGTPTEVGPEPKTAMPPVAPPAVATVSEPLPLTDQGDVPSSWRYPTVTGELTVIEPPAPASLALASTAFGVPDDHDPDVQSEPPVRVLADARTAVIVSTWLAPSAEIRLSQVTPAGSAGRFHAAVSEMALAVMSGTVRPKAGVKPPSV
jgi:hypothetical protein